MFSEEADWAELSAGSRNEFVSRLTSGVVWDYVLRNLDEAEISYLSAQVHHFEVLSGGNAGLLPEVQVHSHPPVPRGAPWTQPMDRREGAVFIDARGFDRWDFVSRLSPTLQSHFQDRTAVEAGVTHSLMVGQTALPTAFPLGLHCPMLASFQGPASSNLMALGWMADRILNFYVQKPVSLPSLSGIALPSP